MEEIFWFHLNKEHGAYNGIESGLEAKFTETRPINLLSLNDKIDNKETLIKLVAELGWYDSPDADFIKTSPALLRTYTPIDHDEAKAMVKAAAWTG